MIGLYTECLLKLLTTPNMGVLEMLNRVGNNVSELAKRQGLTQQPVCVSLCSKSRIILALLQSVIPTNV